MFDGQPKELVIYETAARARPFAKWLRTLADAQARMRIRARMTRLEEGNPGDYRPSAVAFMSCALITVLVIASISGCLDNG